MVKWIFEHFRHCPRCGAETTPPPRHRPLHCAACGFRLFFGPAAAVGAFVFRPDGQTLWLRRAKPPGQGLLGLAGGFVDVGETVEAALRRELKEEVGLTVASARFLCSAPNEYDFAEVRYPVCDLFFEVRVPETEVPQAQAEEVAGWIWRRIEEVDPEQIAFPSVRQAFATLRGRLGSAPSTPG